MARPGWLDENRTRAYPFIAETVGVNISGTPTVRNLPSDAIVDAGFVAGPSSGFVSAGDYVYLNRVWRTNNRFYFEFLSTSSGLVAKPLVFSRNVTNDEFITTFEELNRIEAENSASTSETPCDDILEWSGFITTGSLDSLAELMNDGDVWSNLGSHGRLEPATIQNLNLLLVRSVSVANADRTVPSDGTECGEVTNYDPGMIRPWQECLLGRLLFKPGFNITIEQDTANNAINFRPTVGEGEGEPCDEVPTYPAEGEEGDDLSGALRCRDVLRSINGQGGSVFSLEANAGFSLIADPNNNRLVIDANFANMEACIEGVSQSVFVPEPGTTAPPAGTTTTTTTTLAPLWQPSNSNYPLRCWLKPETLSNTYSNGEDMDLGWFDSSGFSNSGEVVNPPESPQAFLNVLNSYAIMQRVNTQGLKFLNLLANSGGTFSTYMMVRVGVINIDPAALMDTTNGQWSVFQQGYTSVGGNASEGGVTLELNEWALISLECAGPGGSYSLRLNGNPILVGSALYGFFNELVLGLNPSGQGTSNGITQYAEFAAFYAVLPASERNRMEGYMLWKFGLEQQLPLNHPYRFIPPRV